MKKSAYVVGVLGAELVGQEIASALEDRAFPLAALRVFGGHDILGEAVDVGTRSVLVEMLDDAVGRLDFVFLAGDVPIGGRETRAIRDAGAVAIDCSGQFALASDVPLIVPECNAKAVAGYTARGIVASPDPVAVALSTVLAPLHALAGVRRAVVTAMESVSGAGAAGIDELSRQTVEVLNGRSVESDVFPSRICFNVLPWIGTVGPGGNTAPEERVVAQVHKILGDESIQLSVSRVRVPTFYGTGLAVNVELERALLAEAAQEMLRESPGLLAAGAQEAGLLTVADAVGQDATLVTRVRADPSVAHGLNLWLAIDNVRKGYAVNAVQIAEILIRDYL